MEDGQANRSPFVPSDTASWQLQEALQKLKSASALISVTIKEEFARTNSRQPLERLYCVKGGLTCAIEELEMHVAK